MAFRYASPDGFTPAKARKKRGLRTPAELLVATRAELERGGWLAHVSQDVCAFTKTTNIKRALCLGLGSPSGSPVARAQLALLVCVSEQLKITPEHIVLFDPVFTAEDRALITQLGMCPLDQEQLLVTESTLVFMPHCELDLYERMWHANWAADALPRILLVGNDLREYAANRPAHELAQKYPCVSQIAGHLVRHAIEPPPKFNSAFNNTACQMVNTGFIPSDLPHVNENMVDAVDLQTKQKGSFD